MVTLENLREEMKKYLSQDKELHMVEVHADTVDEALADAAVQLDTKVGNLHYEVIERGSDGFLGLGKKPWKLKIYQDPSTITKKVKLASDGLFDNDEEGGDIQVQQRDGMFYVRHFGSDICLKVVNPIGEGTPVNLKDVLNEIKREDTTEFDEGLISKYIKQGTEGKYNTVGQYKHVSAGDVLISVDITKDELKGSIIVSPPSMSGSEASEEMIMRSLQQQGVIEQCFNMDKI